MTDLDELQRQLARALTEDAPVPEGFDAERVRAAARTLTHKKEADARRAVEREGGETPMRRLARALLRSIKS